MKTSILLRAIHVIDQALADSPPRIVDVRTVGNSGVWIILESAEARFRLVLDVDPEFATAHTESLGKKSPDLRGGFGGRLRGGFLASAAGASAAGASAAGASAAGASAAGASAAGASAAGASAEARFRVRFPDAGADGDLSVVVRWRNRGHHIAIEGTDGEILEKLPTRDRAGTKPDVGQPDPDVDPRPPLAEIDVQTLAIELENTPPKRWPRLLARLCRDLDRVEALGAILGVAQSIGDELFDASALATALRSRTGDSAPGPPVEEIPHLYYIPVDTTFDFAETRCTSEELGLPRVYVAAIAPPFLDEYEDVGEQKGARRASSGTSSTAAPNKAATETPSETPSETPGARPSETPTPRQLMAILSKAHRAKRRVHGRAELAHYYDRRMRDEVKRLMKLRKKISDELGSDEEGKRLRRFGEAILAHLHAIEKGASEFVCADFADPNIELRIPLDPARPATDAANNYFTKAKRWERGRPLRKKRIEKLDGSVAEISMLQAQWSGPDRLPRDAAAFEQALRDKLKTFYKKPSQKQRVALEAILSSALEDSGGQGGSLDGGSGGAGGSRAGVRAASSGTGGARGGGRGVAGDSDDTRGSGRGSAGAAGNSGDATNRPTSDRGRRPGPDSKFNPRKFEIRDGWTVLVGKSNEENDYVTHKMGKQDDYWFHAHGVPGSHVILRRAGRKDNPSSKALEAAAEIAAFYSKAKNSRKAPVVYTLKKYVRKPRGGKAGLAICQREKTLMVVPTDPEAGKSPDWMDD